MHCLLGELGQSWSPDFNRSNPDTSRCFAPSPQKKNLDHGIQSQLSSPRPHKLHASTQAKLMSLYWVLLHSSLCPSSYSQRVHPETACFEIACCYLFVLSALRLLSVILPLHGRNCRCLCKVKFSCGVSAKRQGRDWKKKCLYFIDLFFFSFSGLQLHLVTAWKKKPRYFWYEHIVLCLIRPAAAVKVSQALKRLDFCQCSFLPDVPHH